MIGDSRPTSVRVGGRGGNKTQRQWSAADEETSHIHLRKKIHLEKTHTRSLQRQIHQFEAILQDCGYNLTFKTSPLLVTCWTDAVPFAFILKTAFKTGSQDSNNLSHANAISYWRKPEDFHSYADDAQLYVTMSPDDLRPCPSAAKNILFTLHGCKFVIREKGEKSCGLYVTFSQTNPVKTTKVRKNHTKIT